MKIVIFLIYVFFIFFKKGRPIISKDITIALNEHVKSLSNVASNRLICMNPKKTGEKEMEAVRYLNCSLTDAYTSFKHKNEICFSTFCKHMEKRYKKPHRLTDICRYREYGLHLKKDILKHATELNYIQSTFNDKDDTKFNIDTKNMLQFFKGVESTDKSLKTISQIEEIVAIQFHRKVAAIQRDAYNKNIKDVNALKDSLLIELDFKQKVVIGSSPRQVSSEYYNHIQKSFLGIIFF